MAASAADFPLREVPMLNGPSHDHGGRWRRLRRARLVGRPGDPSRLLMVLFTLWVVSPFIAFTIVDRLSHRYGWSRTTLHWLMLIVGTASVAADLYVALRPPVRRRRPYS